MFVLYCRVSVIVNGVLSTLVAEQGVLVWSGVCLSPVETYLGSGDYLAKWICKVVLLRSRWNQIGHAKIFILFAPPLLILEYFGRNFVVNFE